jgi:hypothetical protein
LHACKSAAVVNTLEYKYTFSLFIFIFLKNSNRANDRVSGESGKREGEGEGGREREREKTLSLLCLNVFALCSLAALVKREANHFVLAAHLGANYLRRREGRGEGRGREEVEQGQHA